MTLIITALNPSKIVQVSDQRLTLDGRSYDDYAVKSIFVKSNDAATCISYTGRAFIGPRLTRTDLWLCDNLQQWTVLPLPALVESLGKRLSAVDLRGDSLTIVGASYKDGTSWPVLFLVSNVHDVQGDRLTHVAKQFTVLYWAPSEKSKEPPMLLHVAGAEDALNPSARRYVKRFGKKKLHVATPSGSAEVLMRFIRSASQRSTVVGSNCIGIGLIPGQDAQAFYWPEGGHSPVQLMPHVVGEFHVSRSVQVSGSPESPSVSVPFEEWPQLKCVLTYNGEFFTITNAGAENWRRVRLDLNGRPLDYRSIAQGWSYGAGYVYFLPALNAGDTVEIGAAAFLTMREGRSFHPIIESIRDLVLVAQLPDGRFGRYIFSPP